LTTWATVERFWPIATYTQYSFLLRHCRCWQISGSGWRQQHSGFAGLAVADDKLTLATAMGIRLSIALMPVDIAHAQIYVR